VKNTVILYFFFVQRKQKTKKNEKQINFKKYIHICVLLRFPYSQRKKFHNLKKTYISLKLENNTLTRHKLALQMILLLFLTKNTINHYTFCSFFERAGRPRITHSTSVCNLCIWFFIVMIELRIAIFIIKSKNIYFQKYRNISKNVFWWHIFSSEIFFFCL